MSGKRYPQDHHERLERSPQTLLNMGFRNVRVLRMVRMLYHAEGTATINWLTHHYERENIYAAIEDGLIELVRGMGPRLTDFGRYAYTLAIQWGSGSPGWSEAAPRSLVARGKRLAAAVDRETQLLRVQQMQQALREKYAGTGKWTMTGHHWHIVIAFAVVYGEKEPGQGGPVPPIRVIKWYRDGTKKVYEVGDHGFAGALKTAYAMESAEARRKRAGVDAESHKPPYRRKLIINWQVEYDLKAPGVGGWPVPIRVTAFYNDGTQRVYEHDAPAFMSALKRAYEKRSAKERIAEARRQG